jgi:hypothetical protein
LRGRGKVNQISFSQQRKNQPNEKLNGLRKETQAVKEGQRTIREALRKVDRVKERPATTQPRPRRFVLNKSIKFGSAARPLPSAVTATQYRTVGGSQWMLALKFSPLFLFQICVENIASSDLIEC